MELPDKDLYFPRLQFARFGYQVMGFGAPTSRGFVDSYSGTRLKSQGTGARYNCFGGGWVSGTGFDSRIFIKNPFNGTDATTTGDLEFGKASVGVASNGTRIIGSGGYASPSSTSGETVGWTDDGTGPYVVSKIEYYASSSGTDAADFGDVHFYLVGYPPVGSSNTPSAAEDDTARFYFGSNAVGADGATGFYAGGSGRYTEGRGYTEEVWKITIDTLSDSEDWGANLDYWKSDLSGIDGYTGTQGSLDIRWLMMGGKRRDVDVDDAGSATVQFEEVRYFTYASPSTGTDFGDPHATAQYSNGNETVKGGQKKVTGSNGTRGVAMGNSNKVDVDSGETPGTGGDTGGEWVGIQGNTIEYYTIASTDNAAMFGNMTITYSEGNGQACNGQYLESWGGYKKNDRPDEGSGGTAHDIVDQISIASTGDAVVNGAHLVSNSSGMDTVQNGGTGSN